MWGQVQTDGLTPSKIDTRILATAFALGIRVVTDDQGMLELAADYGVETWTTLELMKSMLDAGHITMKKVRQVVQQWVYDEDLPAKKLRQPYKEFFGEDPPPGF
jgi:predicted nuclease of predicted toxin-antitoxin system